MIDFKEWAAEEQAKADEFKAVAEEFFDGTWSGVITNRAQIHEARAQFLSRRADEGLLW